MVRKLRVNQNLEELSREELIELVLKLQEENLRLRQRVSELEEKLTALPLKGGFRAKLLFKPSVRQSKNKPGQKEGHNGSARPMPEKIHEEKELTLRCCPECGSEVKEVAVRQRVVENIKPAQAHNVRYTIYRYYCKRCDKLVEPKPMDVIPHCRFGLALMLYVLILRYAMRLPYNRIVKLLHMCFGIRVSEGALVGAVKMLASYLGKEYEKLKEEVKQLKHVHVDETGWRVSGKNYWLWDFIGEKVALYRIHKRRSSEVAKETLSEFKGTIVSDCCTAYNPLNYSAQKCWVHLLRDTRELESEAGKRMHRRLKRLLWDALRAKEQGSAEVISFQRRLAAIASAEYQDAGCAKIAKRLQRHSRAGSGSSLRMGSNFTTTRLSEG